MNGPWRLIFSSLVLIPPGPDWQSLHTAAHASSKPVLCQKSSGSPTWHPPWQHWACFVSAQSHPHMHTPVYLKASGS